MGAPFRSCMGAPFRSCMGAPFRSCMGAPFRSCMGAPFRSCMGAPFRSCMNSSNVGMLRHLVRLVHVDAQSYGTVLLWRGDNRGHPRRRFANGHLLDCVLSEKSQFLLLDLWSHVEGNFPVCNRDRPYRFINV